MRTFKFITNIFMGVLLAVLVIAVVAQILDLRFFGIQTQSMEPDLPVGTLVITAPSSLSGNYQKGDIVSFYSDDALRVTTHRIIAVDIRTETITTQGDVDTAPDPAVAISDVIGKVIFAVPYLGYLTILFSAPPAKITFVALLVVVVILSLLLSTMERDEKKISPSLTIVKRKERHDFRLYRRGSCISVGVTYRTFHTFNYC